MLGRAGLQLLADEAQGLDHYPVVCDFWPVTITGMEMDADKIVYRTSTSRTVDDADLFAVRTDQPHLGDADPVVDAGLVSVWWRCYDRSSLNGTSFRRSFAVGDS